MLDVCERGGAKSCTFIGREDMHSGLYINITGYVLHIIRYRRTSFCMLPLLFYPGSWYWRSTFAIVSAIVIRSALLRSATALLYPFPH
jgi:hypothetical protein